MARNTGSRTLVYVKATDALPDFKYGFRSGLDAGKQATLGQIKVEPGTTNLTGFAIGVNNIKPGKASKRFATGTESSFYGQDVKAALKAAGWQLTQPKVRTPRKTKFSTPVYVTINGVKYGWRTPTPPTGVGGADLGIKAAPGTAIDIIYGASFPKPPRASILLPDGSTFSSFVDPSKADKLPDGYALVDSGAVVLV